MTRFFDNLSEDQLSQLWWLTDKWRDCENASNLDCFQVGQIIQEVLISSGSAFTTVAYDKAQPKVKGGTPTAHITCGYSHKAATTHSWADCINNPINKNRRSELIAKFKCDSSSGKGAGRPKMAFMEAKLATAEDINNVLSSEKQQRER